MSANYTGATPDQIYGAVQDRFFYGLRRTDNGELFLAKADQFKRTDSITINKSGSTLENLPSFQPGQDFYEGRNVKHDLVYENLNYEQFLWSDKNLFYYVNADGELVVKIYEQHTYDGNSSSEGIE
jgi:hypothetical protein